MQELEQKLQIHKKPKSPRKNGSILQSLCLSLPIHLEREEIVILGKQGSIFDEYVVKDAIKIGFANSRQVREDATLRIRKHIESITSRRINLMTYEHARLDNSVLWESPQAWIEL